MRSWALLYAYRDYLKSRTADRASSLDLEAGWCGRQWFAYPLRGGEICFELGPSGPGCPDQARGGRLVSDRGHAARAHSAAVGLRMRESFGVVFVVAGLPRVWTDMMLVVMRHLLPSWTGLYCTGSMHCAGVHDTNILHYFG